MRLKALSAVLASLCLPAAALADCVTAADLKAGIAVTVKGGSVQTFRKKGGDVLASVPVMSGGSGFTARQRLVRGLFVADDNRTFHEAADTSGKVIVGGNDGGTRDDRYFWDSGAQVPEPGAGRTLRLKVTRDEDGPSIGPQPRVSGVAEASVQTQAEKTVKISGCSYRIWPVETKLVAVPGTFGDEGGTILTRRQIWFPDLGFAVTTKETGSMSGWNEDWGQGIIGMAPAQ